MSEWISVEDKPLPVNEEVVVLSLSPFWDAEDKKTYFTGLATLEDNGYLTGYNFNNIKFWMSLPEPPQE